jgi:hypothetical protein
VGHDTEKKERLAAFERRIQEQASAEARAKGEAKRKRFEASAARKEKAEAARRRRAEEKIAEQERRAADDQKKINATDEFAQFRAKRLEGGAAPRKTKTYESGPVYFGSRKGGLAESEDPEDQAKLERLRAFEKKTQVEDAKQRDEKRRAEVARQRGSQDRLRQREEEERRAALHAAAEAALQAQVDDDQRGVGDDFAKFRAERRRPAKPKRPPSKRRPNSGRHSTSRRIPMPKRRGGGK